MGDGTANTQCAVNACIVEGTFTLKYLAELTLVALGDLGAITGHANYTVAHAHIGNNEGPSPGTFDPDVECPACQTQSVRQKNAVESMFPSPDTHSDFRPVSPLEVVAITPSSITKSISVA